MKDIFEGDVGGLKRYLYEGHLQRQRIAQEIRLREMEDIPQDAWAFRLRHWVASSGEQLVGQWHRTTEWFRRDGTYSGLRSACGRVYNSGSDMELVGAPDQHPLGYLCPECFGLTHSDQLTTTQED